MPGYLADIGSNQLVNNLGADPRAARWMTAACLAVAAGSGCGDGAATIDLRPADDGTWDQSPGDQSTPDGRPADGPFDLAMLDRALMDREVDLLADDAVDFAVVDATDAAPADLSWGDLAPPACPPFGRGMIVPFGQGFPGVRVADLNGDGHVDVVAETTVISTLLGDGTGHLAPPIMSPAVFADAFDVRAADFDHDGNQDIVVSTGQPNQMLFLRGDGKGTVSLSGTFQTGITPLSMRVDDLNGDGNLDVAVAILGQLGQMNPYVVTLFFGDGAGNFQAGVDLPAPTAPVAVESSDFDQDGVRDLVVVGVDGPLAVLRGLGAGKFGAYQVIASVAQVTLTVSVADMNGDQWPDLVQPSQNDASIVVVLNAGNGTFLAPAKYATGALNPNPMHTGDFDGDGSLDVVVGTAGNTLTVLFGDGQGHLGAPVTCMLPSFNNLFDVADLDEDGKADVVMAIQGGSLLVLFGK